MRPPRGLSDEEAAAWARVADTVQPIGPVRGKPARPDVTKGPSPAPLNKRPGLGAPPKQIKTPKAAAPPVRSNPPPSGAGPSASRSRRGGGLDSHWDRRLKAGDITPELTLDLHDYRLDGAYRRLMDGMEQARGMGARTVLLVTGKPRGGDAADRGERRGAIRAKILDWLAASEHGDAIAAVRKAHQRHGGEGALYVVLRRSS